MTRFARAKGSKASNERVANDATPWHVMKENLQAKVSIKRDRAPNVKSAKELLTDKDQPYYHDSTGNVNNEWAEFEKKDKKPTIQREGLADYEESKKTKKKKPREEACSTKKEKTAPRQEENFDRSKISPKLEKDSFGSSESEKRPKRSSETADREKSSESPEVKHPAVEKKIPGVCEKGESTGKISKRQKRNRKRLSKIAPSKGEEQASEVVTLGQPDALGDERCNGVSLGAKADGSGESTAQVGLSRNAEGKMSTRQPPKRKAPKIRDDKEHKRRKPMNGPIKCTINGTEVEIVMYDGYPVKREDAERLADLRKKMVMKAIPKSEINQAMKLERRKAEKALARVRKQVCFHCRKAGHNLSDCPELGKEECATGICFKCGSTEHTHFECRVTKKEEFRFASCFICREQGHIAKQCPDNPRGLYPQGGSCKICGDVTHLKKDCPDMTRERDETTVTVGTIADSTIESLDDDSPETHVAKNSRGKTSKSKIVQF